MASYANPEMLVSTEWVDEHRNDTGLVLVEVDVDSEAYFEGHIPGAIGWDWQTQLCDPVRRDVLSREQLEELLGSAGITPESTIVLYGDNNNWFAAWALWQLKMYGHRDVRLMDGGRRKWLSEGRELSLDTPQRERTEYHASEADAELRAFQREVFSIVEKEASGTLVDVRSNDEFSGKILAPVGLKEMSQRGGHIPGARNVPWGVVCNPDGTFRSADELRAIYAERGITPDQHVVTYCRIGERSSHSWFVLKYLLGFPKVSNYDGSWTEWGNMVGAPVEK